jgi:hypothetical protein
MFTQPLDHSQTSDLNIRLVLANQVIEEKQHSALPVTFDSGDVAEIRPSDINDIAIDYEGTRYSGYPNEPDIPEGDWDEEVSRIKSIVFQADRKIVYEYET